MEGLGTREDALIDIMCTSSNADLRQIASTYQLMFRNKLEKDLMGDTSGYFGRLMVCLSAANRDESNQVDMTRAANQAKELKAAGVDRIGTSETEFLRILCSANYSQLKAICDEYQKLAGRSLETDIKKEFSGDIETGLLAIIEHARSPTEYFARALHKSMKGMGTRDRALIRACIMRCEVDMLDVKDAFKRLFGQTLKSFIACDTSGDYRRALLALCGETYD
jgi:annexin A7/11